VVGGGSWWWANEDEARRGREDTSKCQPQADRLKQGKAIAQLSSALLYNKEELVDV
jgi:hypothetical protein